jgi:hypothetical protein
MAAGSDTAGVGNCGTGKAHTETTATAANTLVNNIPKRAEKCAFILLL